MQKQISVIALVFAVTLVGCAKDGGNNNNNNDGKDMAAAKRDLSEPEETPDLRRVRDFSDPPSEDLAVDPNADMVVDPNADMVVDPNADMVVDPNADMVVDPNADMVVDPNADMVVDPSADLTPNPNADMVVNPNADMGTTPTCSATPTAALRRTTFAASSYGETNLNGTLTLAKGFLIEGIVNWPSAYENSFGNFAGGSIEFVNRATGERFFGSIDGTDADPDMYFIYSVAVPAGSYDVNTSIYQGYGNDARVTSFATRIVDVCGDDSSVDIDHDAMPELPPRAFSIGGLGSTYDADIDPNFWGIAMMETTDGKLFISMPATDFDDTTDFALTWDGCPLPNGAIQPSLWAYNQPYSAAYGTEGYDHVYRLPMTTVLAGDFGDPAFAADPTIAANTVVRLSGSVTDSGARLGREFAGFDDTINANRYFVSHNVVCTGAAGTFTQQYGQGYLSTTTLGYDTPVQKGVACSVQGNFKVRVPFADNVGAPPPAPGSTSDTNRTVTLFSEKESLTPDANTTRNFTIPAFAAMGETTQTITIKDAAGAAVADALVLVESAGGLTTAPTFNATTAAITNASGQVTLRLIRGSYKVTVDLGL